MPRLVFFILLCLTARTYADGARDVMTYNAVGQLTNAASGKYANSVSYEYDALGRRIAKTVTEVEGETSTTTTIYTYTGPRVIAEYTANATADAPTQSYIYGPYIDEPVAMVKTSGTSGVFYYHHNQQYSITALSGATGTVTERYAYDAYGQPTIYDAAENQERPESAVGNPYLYTARRYDPGTGLYYFRARYYDANLGRFLARDPLGYIDGMSLYRGYFVPDGLDPWGLYGWSDFIKEFDPTHPSGLTHIVIKGWSQVVRRPEILVDIGMEDLGGNDVCEGAENLATNTVEMSIDTVEMVADPGTAASHIATGVKKISKDSVEHLKNKIDDHVQRVGGIGVVTAPAEIITNNTPGGRDVVDGLTGQTADGKQLMIYDLSTLQWRPANSADRTGKVLRGFSKFLTAYLIAKGIQKGHQKYRQNRNSTKAGSSQKTNAKPKGPCASEASNAPKTGVTMADGAPSWAGSQVRQYAKNVKGVDGFTDVFIHGTRDGRSFAVMHNGREVILSHRQVAGWLRSQGVQGNIRLISCHSGSLPNGSVAQNLANKLGVTVRAPTNAITVHPNGVLTAPKGTQWRTLTPGSQ